LNLLLPVILAALTEVTPVCASMPIYTDNS